MSVRGCALAAFGGLLLAMAGCGESPRLPPPPDLVLLGAELHGATPAGSDAFAVTAGRFSAIGDSAEIRALAGPDTEIVEAGGAAVLPGLIDGHVHIEGAFNLVRGVDLTGIADKRDWLARIAARAAELPEGAWLLGGRWDHSLSDGVLPTRAMLDSVVADRPVALADIDGHSLWLNSRALDIAGIAAASPVPPGGEIVLDPEDGTPTGILKEGAMRLVAPFLPDDADPEARRALLSETVAHMNSLGLTGAHNLTSLDRLDDWLALLEAGELNLRIWSGVGDFAPERAVAFKQRRRDLAEIAAPHEEERGPLLRLGYIKLFADGVLSTRTAALLEPYADRPDLRGTPFHEADELGALVNAAHEAGFPVAVHAIGDRAVRMVLDAFEASPIRPVLPDRVEHVELIDATDLSRFSARSITASMQPHHAVTTFHNYLEDRVGTARSELAYAWKSIADVDRDLIFGSDWPTAPLAPLAWLAAATERVSALGRGDGPWHGEQRLAFREALRAITLAPARAAGQEHAIGSIEVGKWADFVLLDRALGETPEDGIGDATIRATRLAGKEVWRAP